jgi:hypothetical protein
MEGFIMRIFMVLKRNGQVVSSKGKTELLLGWGFLKLFLP